MHTTILLDDQLFQEATRYAHTENPDELIQLALREFIHHRRLSKAKTKKRRLGMDKGRFDIPENFDAPDADIEKAFYDNA